MMGVKLELRSDHAFVLTLLSDVIDGRDGRTFGAWSDAGVQDGAAILSLVTSTNDGSDPEHLWVSLTDDLATLSFGPDRKDLGPIKLERVR
jgi:hypothetical protein